MKQIFMKPAIERLFKPLIIILASLVFFSFLLYLKRISTYNETEFFECINCAKSEYEKTFFQFWIPVSKIKWGLDEYEMKYFDLFGASCTHTFIYTGSEKNGPNPDSIDWQSQKWWMRTSLIRRLFYFCADAKKEEKIEMYKKIISLNPENFAKPVWLGEKNFKKYSEVTDRLNLCKSIGSISQFIYENIENN